MRPQRLVLWLRVASVVSLLFAAGHTLGGLKAWAPTGETPALTAMRTSTFAVEGVSRTFLDFYRGFGFSLSVFMLLQAVVLWQLAALARRDAVDIRPTVGAFAVASLGLTAISWALILPIPTIFSAVLTVCLAIAFVAARPASDAAAAIG